MARDLRRGEHLPKLRPDGRPLPPSWLPRQRRGVTPQMIGRYPDYDVFAAEATWDEVTAGVVKARLHPSGRLRFFTPAEEPTLRAFCDTVLAQDSDPRVPVPEMVDAKFADGRLDGYRFEDMPEDPETWRRVLRGLDAAAGREAGQFAALGARDRESIVERFAAGELQEIAEQELDVARAWSVVMRAALAAFYSHPWAWNEIGFGGPAYPRGYMRLGQGVEGLEPFERRGASAEDPERVVDDES